MRIERIDPLGLAEDASRILRESWPLPSIDQSPAYLRWQFNPPGEVRPLGVVARDGGGPVGFAAVVPRRVRHAERRAWVYLLSFVAVHPAWRGQGVAVKLYKTLLDGVRSLGLPFLAFTIPGTAGRRALERGSEAAGYRLWPLGEYPAYGGRYPATEVSPLVEGAIVPASVVGEALEFMRTHQDDRTLWADPDEETFADWLADPRPNAPVLVRGKDGRLAGFGMAVRCHYLTARGGEDVTTVDRLFLGDPVPWALRKVAIASASLWPDGDGPQSVMASNLHGVDPSGAKEAGFRKTPSLFACHLGAVSETHPFPGSAATNLMIV